MPNADLSGFMLAAIAVGLAVSVALVLPLIYTMGVRGWGLGNKTPWPVTVVGTIWLMFVGGGAMFLGSLCAHRFGIEGTSHVAQSARSRFGLLWMGMGTFSMLAAVVVIARRKQRRENAAASGGEPRA
jgi:hypothetical protein